MEQTDGGDTVTCGTKLDENSESDGIGGDSCSSLKTEINYDEQPGGTTTVDAHNACDIVSSLSVTDSSVNNTTDKKDENTDVSVSYEGSQCDNNLSQKIVTQVEYYFSDENLVKDTFLMQRIHRDKRGYVDMKLISSFKKMTKLTRDIDVIAAALRNSKKLEVNKGGTMVRRIAPPPVTKEEVAALKTVVAVNFSETGNLDEQFGSCGPVTRVRIVSKNDTVPSDVRKHLKRSLDDDGRVVTAIALIEYEDEKCAQTACEHLTDSSDWRHGLHVSLLVARQLDKKSASNKLSPTKENNVIHEKSFTKPVESDMQSLRTKKKGNKKNRSRVEALLQDESAGCSSSGSETDGTEEQGEHRHSGSRSKRRFSSPRGGTSPANRSNVAHSVLAHHNVSIADDLYGEARARSGSTGAIEYNSRGISPWVQRRLEAAQRESKSAGGSVNDLSAGDTVPLSKITDTISVLRQPRGPDGTRGFSLLR